MNELDLLKTSLKYLDNLACGFDPFTGEELGDSLLKNERLSRCFFFVCGVLERKIESLENLEAMTEGSGPTFRPRSRNEASATFSFSKAELASIPISETPLKISEFCANLGSALGVTVSATTLTNWLLRHGFLEKDKMEQRIPTKTGEQIGIHSKVYLGSFGSRFMLSYDANAQRFLLDHLNEILAAKIRGTNSKGEALEHFSITAEQISAIKISESGVVISEFCRKVNEQIDPEKLKKLAASTILNWLQQQGFLEIQLGEKGEKHKRPTAKGTELGLFVEERTNDLGKRYKAVFYNTEAQKFLLRNLPEIAANAP